VKKGHGAVLSVVFSFAGGLEAKGTRKELYKIE
jgi:hypothetical protein